MSRTRLIAAMAAVAMVTLPSGAGADPVTIRYGVDAASAVRSGYGDLRQGELKDCGDLSGFGCGPVAAVNSLVWLQNRFPLVYGKKLVPELNRRNRDSDINKDGIVDARDDMIAVAETLALDRFMKTCCNRSTLRNDFYRGKRDYIELKAPGLTDYAVMDDPYLDIVDPNGRFDLTPGLERAPPSWDFLVKALREDQDVELLVTRDDGTKLTFGHYITLTGLEFVDANGNGRFDRGETAKLHAIGPEGGPATRELIMSITGRLSYIAGDRLPTDIRMAVEESPNVTAPPSAALLGLAAALLLARRFGRQELRATRRYRRRE